MAVTEAATQERPDRQGRRRPLLTWVKKLRNLNKGSSSSSADPNHHGSSSSPPKRDKTLAKKRPSKLNNPYPESGRIGNGNGNARAHHNESRHSVSTGPPSGVASSLTSVTRTLSIRSSTDGRGAPLTAGARSMAPTVSTDHEATQSIAAPSQGGASSVAGTSRTAGGGLESRRGGDSTFSSPAPSVRSLTTTLTTIQSLPLAAAAQPSHSNHSHSHNHHHHHASSNSQVVHFNQPFPSTPASAVPPYLTSSGSQQAQHAAALYGSSGGAGAPGHPTTYTTATANGLLTDNASVLTLASSSKRRRRRSLDTDASVRALAPSSLFGGSRESLPLSVLSAPTDSANLSGMPPTTPGAGPSSRANAERTSMYSVSGIAPAMPSGGSGASAGGDRSSFYAKQQQQCGMDGASVRSGLLGHGRADSVAGSTVGVIASAPLASPREDPGGEDEMGEKEQENEKDAGQKT